MAKSGSKKTKSSKKGQKKQEDLNVSDFIEPLYMNGLQGRMLRMPGPKNKSREILLIYGHHSTLERWWGVIQDLNQYGTITVPDIPGFGGMESLYKIGEKPNIDTLADYLAAFIKLRFKRRRITVMGLSFGFVVITRMLQRYPDLAKKVDMAISVVGFAHTDDFQFSKTRKTLYYLATKAFSGKFSALMFRNTALHPYVIKTIYGRTHNAKNKFQGLSKKRYKQMMEFEVHLWHANDVRTHMYTGAEFLRLDNCKRQVDLPLWHIAVKSDKYFDNDIVEQHMRVIFKEVHMLLSKADGHAPSVVATMEESEPLIPPKLRKALRAN